MLYLIRSACFVSVFFVAGSIASADDPIEPRSADVVGAFSDQGGPILVVANDRLLHLIVTWIDAPAECLFDRRGLAVGDDEQTTPALPIARMLDAKCFVYVPSEELPLEAIYRERLANHGVKVVPIALPSPRRHLNEHQESQRQSLLAILLK